MISPHSLPASRQVRIKWAIPYGLVMHKYVRAQANITHTHTLCEGNERYRVACAVDRFIKTSNRLAAAILRDDRSGPDSSAERGD